MRKANCSIPATTGKANVLACGMNTTKKATRRSGVIDGIYISGKQYSLFLLLYWLPVFWYMCYTNEKLAELQKELKDIVKEVQAGKLSQVEAADKIMHLREEMDKIIHHLKSNPKTS